CAQEATEECGSGDGSRACPGSHAPFLLVRTRVCAALESPQCFMWQTARRDAPRSEGELVGRVERRHLVAFRERRVVEDGLQEVVEAAVQAEDGLADVNQLRRAAADGVHAEQLPSLAVEEHLEEAAVVAEDLATRDLAVACDAGLVRHALASELLL